MLYVLYTFIAAFSIQLIYYLLIFSRVYFIKPAEVTLNSFPTSVLLCARNESENLDRILPLLLAQNYPDFELVLINDGSFDDTLEKFKAFKLKNNTTHNIKIVDVIENENFWGNKKYALSLGIKAASFEQLLFIDADCIPLSEKWIAEIVQNFKDDIEIVLGYGAHDKVKHSLFNKLLRFETLYTAIQYFSYAKIGIPYMGVGRNLAYKKSLFYKSNGFAKHMHIKSGDDDLFINQNATRKNIALAISHESFTSSLPKKDLIKWISQKRRHISTADQYKFIHKFLLGLSYISQLFFWIFASVLLILNYNFILITSIIVVRIFIQYLIIGFSANKLKEKDLIFWIPFFEIFLICVQLYIFIQNKISKPTHW